MSATVQIDPKSTPHGEAVDSETGTFSGGETMSSELLAYLSLFWAARRLLFGAAMAGGVLSLALAMLLPKEYESTTRLMPPDKKASSGSALLAGMFGAHGIDRGRLSRIADPECRV